MTSRTLSLTLEESSRPEVALRGLWTAHGSKRQMHMEEEKRESDLDLADDLKTLWDKRWKSAVSFYFLSISGPVLHSTRPT